MFNRFHLDYYQRIADNWYSILQTILVSDKTTICDFLCGWAPKIWLSLLETNFRWTYYLLDKKDEFLSEAKDMLAIFEPTFDIDIIQKDIIKEKIWGKFDIVVANHVIDDILLEYYCDIKWIDSSSIYDDWDLFMKVWEDIYSDNVFFSSLVEKVSCIFIEMINNDWYLLISQYLWHIEENFNMRRSDEICRIFIDNLINLLIQKWFESRPDIVDSVYKNLSFFYFSDKEIYILHKN